MNPAQASALLGRGAPRHGRAKGANAPSDERAKGANAPSDERTKVANAPSACGADPASAEDDA
jgi:hypothetical protein